MDAHYERIHLKAGIQRLEQELRTAISTNASDSSILELGHRLAVLKDCYTKVLELLDSDSRTTSRSYTARHEVDKSTNRAIGDSVSSTQVVHTSHGMWDSLLRKA